MSEEYTAMKMALAAIFYQEFEYILEPQHIARIMENVAMIRVRDTECMKNVECWCYMDEEEPWARYQIYVIDRYRDGLVCNYISLSQELTGPPKRTVMCKCTDKNLTTMLKRE